MLLLREIKRAKDPVLASILSKIRLGECDAEVYEVLCIRLTKDKVDEIDLDKTVVICSTRAECADFNEQCLERVTGGAVEYCTLDSDHQGHPLRAADQLRIKLCRERLPDVLQVKVGARVILRTNSDIEAGWVNGTLAVVIALYPNCIVIQKAANPSDRLPVPPFRQRLEIAGASYTILRQQFPLLLVYAVTVHRVQGMTVQKAVVRLNSHFFESGQAYVALSHVTTLDSLALWDYVPTTIAILQFYKDLLSWCDYVDAIRPTPPSGESVPYPARADDTSNAPLDTLSNTDSWLNDEVDKTTSTFSKHPESASNKKARKSRMKLPQKHKSTGQSAGAPPGKKRRQAQSPKTQNGANQPKCPAAGKKKRPAPRPRLSSSPQTKKSKQSPPSRKSKSNDSKLSNTKQPPQPHSLSAVDNPAVTAPQLQSVLVDRPLPRDEWKRSIEILSRHTVIEIISPIQTGS